MTRDTTTAAFSATGPMLEFGSTGPEVLQLQLALDAAGFPCGDVDGAFGAATEAALKGFQKSVGLLDDGKAGPRTRSVLAAKGKARPKAAAAAADLPVADFTPLMTVQIASRMLPGAHMSNISKYLPNVLTALHDRALGDRGIILVALATIRAETAGFVPIDEGISRYNTSPNGQPFDLYDFRADLGNGATGDGAKFKGRGFVQLTGKANYREYGAKLKLPLLTQPDMANEPVAAAELLAAFIKDKEQRIKRDLLDHDLRDARKAVNGGSHGLDAFIDAINTGDKLMPRSIPAV